MADTVTLQVELKNNLEQVLGATKGMKLDKSQSERVERYAKGAQLALDSGDLKTFQTNFNSLMKVFKDAAAATGKVSEEIQKMTARQAALNKELNELRDKKTKLETHVKDGKLTNEGAKDFYKDSVDAKKVIKADGAQATRDEIIDIQTALAEFLKETGKTLKQITNEDLKKISEKSGVSLSNRNSVMAAERYVRAEQNYTASVPKQLETTTQTITTKENEYATLTADIQRMSQAAGESADSIEKLYTKISQLGNETNEKVSAELGAQKKAKADKTIAPKGGADLPNFNKQSATIGGAFKQLTLYNVALRAVKKALREAVQTVKELDKYLTEQAMVTGKTREETYKLIGSYQELAAQCGATTKEIAQVATEYMKQGKTIEDSLVLTEAAVKAAKVARVSVGDSVNYLTTALNGFRLEAEDAMLVSDKFAAVAASSATDYDELAIALSKVASQANLAGMSIDYTTALLTKGLETTREAPETMGTALKTIIARMRELGDYGETLDDGMDINNVESQLKYVGIELRTQQGELRSTEEVLDQLGQKWDTLNKNQQAAVAKALAGTRQQSRLIAMMEDYERVTELQEIAQRSAGATAAQAGVYLEGMEAALNKIQVAWEKIVMSVTDSEVIISTLEFVSDILDTIGDFLQKDYHLVPTLTIIVGLTMSALTNKIQETTYAKILNAAEQKRHVIKLKQRQIELKQLITVKKAILEEKKKTSQEKAQVKLATVKKKLQEGGMTAAQAQLATDQINADLKKDELTIQQEITDLSDELQANEMELTMLNQTNESSWSTIASTVSLIGGGLGTLISGSGEWLAIMTAVGFAFKIIPPIIKTIAAISKAYNALEKSEQTTIGFLKMAGAATGLGVPGLFIAAALMTLAGIAGVAAIISAASKQESDTEKMQDLSNEIYKLTEKANALNNIANQFKEIDNQVIKTKKDVEELNKTLESAGDQLDTTREKDDKGNEIEGTSQKDEYEKIKDKEKQLAFIEEAARQAEADANKKRLEAVAMVNGWSEDKKKTMLNDSNRDSDALIAQSMVKTTATSFMYGYIDSLVDEGIYSKEILQETEDLASELISSMSSLDALGYANNTKKLETLVNTIRDTNSMLDGEELSAVDILQNEDNTIADRIQAYQALETALDGDTVAVNALKDAYSDWATIAKWDSSIIKFIDKLQLSVKEVNDLYHGAEVLRKKNIKVTDDEFKAAMNESLKELDPDLGNIEEVFSKHFDEILKSGIESSDNFEEEFAENWDTLMNTVGNILSTSISDMGQNMEKFKNTINNFYEKSLEWSTMSETDKMNFISDNAELFQGESGEALLKAFEEGNYKSIEEALKNTQGVLDEQRKRLLQDVKQTLKIEEGKEDKNTAFIAILKEYEAFLENTEDLYKADLEMRLEQEKNQLDEYKEMLEKEKEALVESLEKRKEAYEKYFDDIDKNQEDEDYEAESELLVTNIAKLASSSDADAKAKTMELEQQLQELEKERIQTLKERAREAILENMDNEVSEINDKFDKLLENSQALLTAMSSDLQDPTEFLSKIISNKLDDGLTQLQFEDYFKDLEGTYSSTLNGVDWDAIKEEIVSQFFLNVNGQDITLNETDERAVYDAVKKALIGIGKR